MIKIAKRKTDIKYLTIKVPSTLVERIDYLMEKEGYTSRTDVIKFAVRLHYNTIRELEK